MTGPNGFSPSAVTGCGAAALALLIAYSIWFPNDPTMAVMGHALCIAAYVIALQSCRRVALSYPKGSPMRLGWLAFCGNCLLSVFRHLALHPSLEPILGTRERVYLASQTLQLAALLCLLFGIVSIWWGVYRLGLGFRVRWVEIAGIASAAVIIAWTFRNNLSHARSLYSVLPVLQAASLALLVAIGGVGLLLNSLSAQMGGGRLAVVMRAVAVYALTRTALTLTQSGRDRYSLAWRLVFYTVPWIFAYGAAYSCWLADSVKRSLREHSGSDWNVSKVAEQSGA